MDQKQQLLMKTQLPNTFHSLFAEGNVLYLLNFQIAGESKWVSFFFFLIKREKNITPWLGWSPKAGVLGYS